MWNVESREWNAESRSEWNPKFRDLNLGSRPGESRIHGVWSPKSREWNTESREWNPDSRIENLEYMERNPESRE